MKKHIIIVLCALLIIYIGCCILFDPYKEIQTLFKPTKYLNYSIDLEKVSKVRIDGISISSQFVPKEYTDKEQMNELLYYLNRVRLVESSEEELPNMSPDVRILFYDNNEEIIGAIRIYGQVFIDCGRGGQVYRSKTEWLIDGLVKLLSGA